MNKSVMRFLALAIGTLALSSAALGADGAAQVDERWKKAVLAGDVEAAVACYGKDAVLWLPGAPMAKGTDEIRAVYEGFFGQDIVKDVALTDTHHETSGNLSVGWGRFTMTTVPKKGGAPVTSTGRFTEVARKVNGRWVYVADHASADPAPAGGETAHH